MTELLVYSRKTYTHAQGLSCCFRQWRAESHCRFLHGYALQVEIVFSGGTDENGWVADFGALKPIKAWLEEQFDHKLLVAEDDPMHIALACLGVQGLAQVNLVKATGCEAFARMIYEYVQGWCTQTYAGRINCVDVSVHEHAGNSAGVISVD